MSDRRGVGAGRRRLARRAGHRGGHGWNDGRQPPDDPRLARAHGALCRLAHRGGAGGGRRPFRGARAPHRGGGRGRGASGGSTARPSWCGRTRRVRSRPCSPRRATGTRRRWRSWAWRRAPAASCSTSPATVGDARPRGSAAPIRGPPRRGRQHDPAAPLGGRGARRPRRPVPPGAMAVARHPEHGYGGQAGGAAWGTGALRSSRSIRPTRRSSCGPAGRPARPDRGPVVRPSSSAKPRLAPRP